ncbi:MAG: sensor histidine kinase [Solirubrobacteraceae bacterium]
MLRRSLRTHITTRVLMLSATVAVLLGSTLIVLIVLATGQRDASRVAIQSQRALTLSDDLRSSLVAFDEDLRDYVDAFPELSKQQLISTLSGYDDQRRELAMLVSSDRRQLARVREIGRKLRSYTIRSSALITLTGDDEEAARNQLFYTGTRVAELGRDLRELAREVARRERMLVVRRERDADAQSQLAIGFGVGGLGLVLLVVAGGALYLRRSVVRPVVSVARATGRLAAGDLGTRVPATREDEVGDLARGFNSMADSLQRGRDELERSNAELTRSNGELEQFASVTSHDLQAPLTTISMYAELLDRKQGDRDDGRDLIDGIRGATHQARALIGDLLEYSRASRGELSVEPLATGVVVEQALELLAGAIESSGARVRVGPLPVVLADRSNLCRVLQNLIANAVKFRRDEPPEVSIDAEPEGSLWRVNVRDNGIGMDPASAPRIFEPFRRLHGEEDYSGTGIGLAVCERIVERHGGRIWVTSTPGEGSVFSFTMPAAELPDGVPGAAAGSTVAAGASGGS